MNKHRPRWEKICIVSIGTVVSFSLLLAGMLIANQIDAWWQRGLLMFFYSLGVGLTHITFLPKIPVLSKRRKTRE